ncbi:MAG TPA: MotA/TolQ/ExbB proton channel family protein, partial [Kofleriaceae bacterium]|nr:MotA/TolQ/ExbB proton channel family protein [Kofleriaceae bacterium]
MNSLSDLLLSISNALLVPDLLAALGLLVLVVAECGLIAAAVIQRRRAEAVLRPILDGLRGKDPGRRAGALASYLALDPLPVGIPFAFAALGERAWRASVRALAQEEAAIGSERRISRLTMCVRLGPMVGLVGTLIPLGPGLVALSQGDLALMASHLTVAFTVTVVGLTTGAVGFLLAGVRRRLDAIDLARLSFIADCMAEQGAPADGAAAPADA